MFDKSAKLTQNTPVVFLVNSMVMTTIVKAGYSTWRADTANSVFGQFKGHNSGVHRGIWLVIELGRDILPTNIFTKFYIKTGCKLFDLASTLILDNSRTTMQECTGDFAGYLIKTGQKLVD